MYKFVVSVLLLLSVVGSKVYAKETDDILDYARSNYFIVSTSYDEEIVTLSELIFIYMGKLKYFPSSGTKINKIFIVPPRSHAQKYIVNNILGMSVTTFSRKTALNKSIVKLHSCNEVLRMLEQNDNSISIVDGILWLRTDNKIKRIWVVD